MKKAIFLVEDIINNKPITLFNIVYKRLIDVLKKESIAPDPLIWLNEISNLLYSEPSDYITFKSASQFMRETSFRELPKDKDIFYFISCFHSTNNFKVDNFLSMDPVVLDFLVKFNIPIIIDGSSEMDNVENIVRELNINFDFIKQSNKYFRGLEKLKIHIVSGTYTREKSSILLNSKFNISINSFPGPFFMYNRKGSELNLYLENNKEKIIKEINSKTILETTDIWNAFCSAPRINRILFQLKVEESPEILNYGKYSRLHPCKEYFHNVYYDLGLHEVEDRLQYVKNNIDKLDEIKIIDLEKFNSVITINSKNLMFFVSLETFFPFLPKDITNTKSFLTEKTAAAIFSGLPFIPLGGQDLGMILSKYGFRDFKKLEFHSYPNLLDEVDHVVESIKEICSLSLKEKNELYQEWKENIVYNFKHYLKIDIKKAYLESIHQS